MYEVLEQGRTRTQVKFSESVVTVPAAGNTELITINTKRINQIFVQIGVITQALDAFIIQGRPEPDGDYHTLFSASGDFTSPTGLLIDASGDLTAQSAGSTGWFVMNTKAIESIKILASAAVDSAGVTPGGSGSE